MEATMLLADFVQVCDGKLTLVGAGWTMTSGGERAVPFGLGIIVDVPWDRANERHQWRLDLIDEDGVAVTQNRPGGPELPIRLTGHLEVGRPPGLPPGSDLQATLAINAPPFPLPEGKGFTWRLSINDVEVDTCSFRTRPS